jgi:heme A synthase
VTNTLSTSQDFFYGCLGGAVAFTVIMLIPELRATWRQKSFGDWTRAAVFTITFLGILQILLGGAVALWLGDASTVKQAVSYGIAAETLVGGLFRSATDDPTTEKRFPGR